MEGGEVKSDNWIYNMDTACVEATALIQGGGITCCRYSDANMEEYSLFLVEAPSFRTRVL